MAMNEQETALVVHAIETGIKTGGESSKNKDIAQAFRLLRTILFDCFKSEYKPGVDILLDFLKSSDLSSTQLAAAVAMLGKYRRSEIISCAKRLLLLISASPDT